MLKLEDLRPTSVIRGLLPDNLATVVNVAWHGTEAVSLIYRDAAGRVDEQLLFRSDEPRLEIVEAGRPWSFDADGALFRLVSEARRIRLAHLFDPLLAVHTSLVEPLPTRSPPCTNPCCRASPCASCWPTTPVPAKPSWPDCSSRK